MNERGISAGGDAGPDSPVEHTPPLARDLSGVGAGYTWKFGEGQRPPAPEDRAGATIAPLDAGLTAEDEVERLRAQVGQLWTALEDVVALALSGADYKERAIMMHRRAVAALSGAAMKPAPRPSRPPPAAPEHREPAADPR